MVQFKDAEANMPGLEAKFKAVHAAGPFAASPFNLADYLTGNPTNPDVIKYKQHDAAYKVGEANFPPTKPKAVLYDKFDSTFHPLLKDPSIVALAEDAKKAQIKMDSMDIKLKGLPVITTGEEKARLVLSGGC